MIYDKKDKTIMIRMSQSDLDKLNTLSEIYNVDRCKLIRIFINTASVKSIERKLEEYENITGLN